MRVVLSIRLATTSPTNSVLIVIAMEAEAKPFVEHLDLLKDDNFFPSHVPFHAFSGTHNGSRVTVVTNGKDHIYETGVDNCGTVPAAVVSFLALEKLKDVPSLVLINAGTCGGFQRKGAAIGDVFLTTGVANHDRRIPIPDFIPYGVGKLDTKVSVLNMATALGFKTGVCTTGNSLDKTEEDDKHMLANDASVKDMEAAAIAWSCALHQVPYLGLKVVTDIVDGNFATQDEFLENLHTASQSLQKALPNVLEYIVGKQHHEL
jgi:5'-methylthioadenosine nucleosidase